MISTKYGQSLWIYSADCIPILIASKDSGNVAACHAGWRGVAKNIPLEAIRILESYGSQRKNIIVALGPAISGSKYQVDLAVAKSIYKSIQNQDVPIKAIISEQIKEMSSLGIIKFEKESSKLLLDIRLAVLNQLTRKGISNDQITICPYCTFSNPKLFHSWRREQAKAWQWSVITSNHPD